MHLKLSDYEAILFDLDGTLVDSMWMWRAIDIEYLARFDIPMPENLQACIEGMSFVDTAVYFKENFGIEDEIPKIIDDWNQMAWDKYLYEVPLKPGVDAFLSKAHALGIKFGIGSANTQELIANALKAHQIRDYFGVILSGSDVPNSKPAPDIYLEGAKRLGVAPKKCLVFEDIIPGITAGKAAGMRVCAVEDAYSADQREDKIALADFYITDYNELLK